MKIYHYREDTGLYIGSSDAFPNPLEAGAYLIPAHATPKKPKADKDGFNQHFENGKWIYKDIPPPAEEPKIKTVEELQQEQQAKEQAEFDAMIARIKNGEEPEPPWWQDYLNDEANA